MNLTKTCLWQSKLNQVVSLDDKLTLVGDLSIYGGRPDEYLLHTYCVLLSNDFFFNFDIKIRANFGLFPS